MKSGSVQDTWDVKTIPVSNLASIGLVGLAQETEMIDLSKEEEIEAGKPELEQRSHNYIMLK